MDDTAVIDADNERHRREEQERRAKRKAQRESKSKSESQTEKERKRREHAQRILQAQKKHHQQQQQKSSADPSSAAAGGSSVFQSLFHQRAQGFLIDLRFRNAPPRPPVGPCFVGLGLEGELTEKWTKYKARNAVEKRYVWKLHCEGDLGVPLAVSALDYEGCYADPDKKGGVLVGVSGGEGSDNSNGERNETDGNQKDLVKNSSHVIPPLHPDDEALIHWKSSLGDTSAEQLQRKRDRALAAARVAMAQGYGSITPQKNGSANHANNTAGTPNNASSTFRLKKKSHLESRILDEKTPQFMKKTTYLTNDATSVHRFTSLARTQEQRAQDVDRALAESKSRYNDMDVIEKGFRAANPETYGNDDEKSKRRRHPTKPDVHPVWDLPLLPDVPTWGHTFTHVVLDHPPKINTVNNSSSKKKGDVVRDDKDRENLVTGTQLHKAIVADVTKQSQNARMACTVWVPEANAISEEEDKDEEPSTKKAKNDNGKSYRAVQRYDLDVYPLRDSTGPAVHFVWRVDFNGNYVGYHPVGSRIQLSTGRPVVLSERGSKGGDSSDILTDKSTVTRRSMDENERKVVEQKIAEVDIDLAEKYGLLGEESNVGVNTRSSAGTSGSGDSKKPQSSDSGDDDDEDMDEDAF
mmetsp:Transcript_848/g.1531  ORF Transcript_848/g.1531 Transcript_848/m.1531 type:complete len:637 (-) Transcript_848:165-2075(-)